MLSYSNSSKQPKPAELVTLSTHIDDHAHDHLQIVIGLQGIVEFDINGRGNYIVPGQGCIITELSKHSFGGVNFSSDILVLNLVADCEFNQYVLQQFNDKAYDDYYFQLDSQIQEIINRLVVEIASSPDDLWLGKSCSNTIIALLNKHMQIFQSEPRSYRLDIKAIEKYVEKHINHKITVAQLAGCVYLSESQFHYQFKAHTGLTPHQYVLSKRVQYAKQLIEQGGLTLSHVAHLSGFSGHSSLTHAFSKHLGTSPSRYRKQYFS
ncbi:helix-turn-helix domain-containing protein [Photobacterium sp. DNB23_23_1]|uniref:AraC family transcriptional regulator n=1 Tax=Photobacterium pectinilyticum TaxID=2906793 RepID=A0ABT1N451_9GAMM|nr:AraC family transcriptional regulator [Photobacterium sp. ZSDE20]MCQ1059327.1 AraC family transcriptional regulator [Photobacterium sp. ZSDE20]MDD1825586.1 AraC family transcriptional regulator [Photobacterium sp. ZSDE20]